MSSSSEIKNRPKISVGLPVYNGEQFLRKRIDSVLDQTFSDFELIISDNASTDSTSIICEEYTKKDNRIRYVRQEKNIGMMPNFYFLLHEAKSDYFVWAAVDDLWNPRFLEKNINALETDKKIVGSISQLTLYDESADIFKKEKEFLKKVGLSYRPHGTYSLVGTYEEKIRTCLKKFPYQLFYGVYRTDKLRRSIIREHFVSDTFAVVLNLLKYGDIYEVNEVLLYVFPGGTSSKGIFHAALLFNDGFFGVIFPHYPFTIWCAKNLGAKLFLKNLDSFIRINVDAEFLLFINIIQTIKSWIK